MQEPDERLLAGLLTLLQGDGALAERQYREFLQAYPENPEGWLGLGFLQLVMNPLRGRSVAEARESLERAVALAPHQLQALVPLAYLAAKERRYADYEELVRRLGSDHDFVGLMQLVSAFSTGDRSAR